MSIARFLSRFLSRRVTSFEDCLNEGPLLKLLVFSGAVSPHTCCYPDEQHIYTDHHFPTAEPCFQSALPFPPECCTTGQADGLFDWDGLLLWAVPKKRTSHSKKRMKLNHKYLKPKANYTVCPTCQNLKLLHVLCGHCLKETLRLTAEMRRAEIEQRLGLRAVGRAGDTEEQASSSETAR